MEVLIDSTEIHDSPTEFSIQPCHTITNDTITVDTSYRSITTESLGIYLTEEEGVEIIDERLVKEADKLYTVINASYTGAEIRYDDVDLLIGKILAKKERNELFFEMVDRVLYHLDNKMKSTDVDTVKKAQTLYQKLKNAIL